MLANTITKSMPKKAMYVIAIARSYSILYSLLRQDYCRIVTSRKCMSSAVTSTYFCCDDSNMCCLDIKYIMYTVEITWCAMN